MSVVFLSASPGFSDEPQPMQYGFPVAPSEVSSSDLVCYMTTKGAQTLDLGGLCGNALQTAASPQRSATRSRSRSVSVPRRRLSSSNYLSQYQKLAETYPDSNVVRMLNSMPQISYAESVCERLSAGLTLEQIRSEDIGKLEPSGRITLDNARKQNIEITLKLAPQYYCP